MGLLDRIGAEGGSGIQGKAPASPEEIRAFVAEFCREVPFFHCVVLNHDGKRKGIAAEISDMAACHGAQCVDLSDKNCVVLLPAALDMELFSHRISGSSGSTVAFQFTSDSPSTALDTLLPYLP